MAVSTQHQGEIKVGGRPLAFETGLLARQADGAVVVRYGDTMVLVTATAAAQPREGIDFFPLTCDYEEKMYAAGKIPGGFFKREGRPGESAVLAARLMDRPIRPLFPKGFRNDIQVIATVLSTDQENDPAILAVNGASAALMVAGLPFEGAVGAVRVGLIGEQLLAAFDVAHAEIRRIVEIQHRLVEMAGKPRREVQLATPDPEVEATVRGAALPLIAEALAHPEKLAREEALRDVQQTVAGQLAEHDPEKFGQRAAEVADLVYALTKAEVRRRILEDGRRPDARKPAEIRPLTIQVGLLPRAHGSGLFQRGQTQVLTVPSVATVRT